MRGNAPSSNGFRTLPDLSDFVSRRNQQVFSFPLGKICSDQRQFAFEVRPPSLQPVPPLEADGQELLGQAGNTASESQGDKPQPLLQPKESAVVGIAAVPWNRDRKGFDSGPAACRHRRGTAGIDTTAEQYADRYIGHELTPHAALQQMLQFIQQFHFTPWP